MNYSEAKYLYFDVKNYTNSYTTTGYTLPITPFTFIPTLDIGTDQPVSNTNLLWDFGDGTTSRDITATHYYSIPGTYNVTCYLFSTGGTGYGSLFTQSVFVKDYITDCVAISAGNVDIIEAGHYQNPFIVIRHNSWQTYPKLSIEGSTISFYASGTGAPLLDAANYLKDKHAHLKPYAKFLAYEYNGITDEYELVPINSAKTNANSAIYVKLSGTNIVPCSVNDAGSTLAGTSGTRVIYFADDLVKTTLSGFPLPQPVITLAYIDTTELYDNDSYGKNIPTSEYPILQQIVSDWYIPTIIDQTQIDHLSITSNGLDGEGMILSSFNIAPNKFVSQKIPFVVKIKDASNYTSKSSKILNLIPNTSTLTANSVHVYLLSSNGSVIEDGVTFASNFGVLSSMTTGGFFRGYVTSSKPYENVRLYAVAQLSGADYYTIPNAHAVIAQPQSRWVHRLAIQQSGNNSSQVQYTDNLLQTAALTGIYTASIAPIVDSIGALEYYIWVADADNDILMKYNVNGNLLLTVSLSDNASPDNIAIDQYGDAWVTLYDSISTIKVNSTTGEITARAVPPYSNQDWSLSSLYISLSGYVGQNSILPTAVDVDLNNDIWVTYSNPLSNFICKYDTNGTPLSTIFVEFGYQPTEVVTTLDNDAWIICRNITTGVNQIGSLDRLINIDVVTGNTLTYELSATAWNLTPDTRGNIWITANKNDILKFDTSNSQITKYALPGSSSIEPESDLVGVACTTNNAILVVNQNLGKIYYFDVDRQVTNTLVSLSSVDLLTPPDLPGTFIQNSLNAFGDWTGFRYINKFHHHFSFIEGLDGYSSTFNIYPIDGKYRIGKKNENFNAAGQLQTYAFQEELSDNTRLFEGFFGSAIGNAQSSPNSIGKKTYEKIANFNENLGHVDTCNIEALKSMHEMLNDNFYSMQSYNFNYPANISRLVDLFSIKFSKLRGSRNMYAEAFDTKGFINSALIYGRNIGEGLDFFTTALTGGVDGFIVAQEKFSNKFHTVNTNIVSASYVEYLDPANQVYALSAYDAKWGWGLVLPSEYTNYDIPKYYNFYQYVPGRDLSQIEGVINWSDPNTTITENISSVEQWYNIIENMLTYTLTQGLGLLSATD